jgi:hypothetical protein
MKLGSRRFVPEQRVCVRCGRAYVARAAHARYCSARCRSRTKERVAAARYWNPGHRGRRAAWRPAVEAGRVRCARGAACSRAEVVDGVLVGGLIRPGEPWDLGHADGESAGGPEHASCNRGAPSRLRARAAAGRRTSRAW